ncbi:unnamed protein product [Polarella glacialis]|uniref:ResB-like domain-containing protein n=1 Tax=Polarella glacialis TaxID=89957 RepID=A0A813GRG4_POLGL|nr:unnamed protein product [Polarella glacialis]
MAAFSVVQPSVAVSMASARLSPSPVARLAVSYSADRSTPSRPVVAKGLKQVSSGHRHSRDACAAGSVVAASAGACLAAAAWRRGSLRKARTLRRGTVAVPPGEEQLPGPNNAVEEWLMTLDLPTPLKPVLGSTAWAGFAAALAQMFVVAGLSALGTFLEQERPAEFYAKNYPDTSGLILALGLDHIYSSPVFLILLAWLGLSLITCTATTQLPLAKKAQKLNFRSSAAMQRRGNFLMRMNCPAAATVGTGAVDMFGLSSEGHYVDPTAKSRLQDLRAELRRRGFIDRVDDEANPTQVAAARGLIGKFAPMIVHLALLLCLVGNTVGLVFGVSSEVIIGDGGFADVGKVLEAGRRSKGPLYDILSPTKGLMDNLFVKVDDFRIDYRDDGEIDQYYSKLEVQDSRTKEKLYSDEIYVNKPLRFGGATIYQADWGIDRLQMYVNGFPIVVPCKPIKEEGQRSWGAFLPLELITAKDPSTVKKITRPSEGIVLIVSNMRNVQVYGSDKNFAGVLGSAAGKVETKVEGAPIQFSDEIIIEGGQKLRLDKIVGSTGLIVKNDPGVPLVYLGYALLMPATLLSVLPFGQVWAAVNKDDPNQLLVSGRVNRNQLGFEDEMQSAVLAVAK